MEDKKMDELEKVEKLRSRANVTYDEARDALRACDGDLLDAMVYLEKLGKVDAPRQSFVTTSADTSGSYQDVTARVTSSERKADANAFSGSFGHFVKTICQKLSDNFLRIEQDDKELLASPTARRVAPAYRLSDGLRAPPEGVVSNRVTEGMSEI